MEKAGCRTCNGPLVQDRPSRIRVYCSKQCKEARSSWTFRASMAKTKRGQQARLKELKIDEQQ